MTNKKYFVYKTTNIINGKYYIGVHFGFINDSYLGSGKGITAAIRKYGKESFIREIIKEFDNKEEAYLSESLIVNQDVVSDHLSYNAKLGGIGGWDHIDSTGDKNCMKNPIIAKKVSEKMKVSLENNVEERLRRSKRMSEGRLNGLIPTRAAGFIRTEEEKQKWRETREKNGWSTSLLGQKLGPDSEEVCQKKSASAQKRCKTEEGLAHMGLMHKGWKIHLCPYCNRSGKGPNFTRHHFEKCKGKNETGTN